MERTSSYSILRQGFRTASSKWGVLGALYLFNLLITLPLALALRYAMTSLLANAPVVDQLFSGFDYTIYSDILRVHSDAILVFTKSFLPVMVVSIVLHAILGVGIVRVMQTDGSVREMASGVVSFGWRAFRLLLIFGLVSVILLGGAGFLSAMIVAGFTEGNSTEPAYLAAIVVSAALFAIVLSFLILGAEYSRIVVVKNDRRSMWKSALEGTLVVLRHPVRMLILHGGVFLSLLIAALIYRMVDDGVGMTSFVGVLLVFLVQQAFILFRLFVRLWNTANGVRFVSTLPVPLPSGVVHAPSVHERGTVRRDRPSTDRTEPAGRPKSGPSGGQGGAGHKGVGVSHRPGPRRRGRRRGGPGGQQGGPPSPQPKKEGGGPPPSQPGTPSGSPAGGRRRRRPRRRRPPGGQQTSQ